MRGLEFLLIFLFGISIMMGYSNMAGSKQVLIFAGSLLSLFYLLAGTGLMRGSIIHRIRMAPPEERPEMIIRFGAGIGFAIGVVGIVFNELYWNGRTTMIFVGVSYFTVLMFFSMRFLEEDEPGANRYFLIRSLFYSLALVFFMVVPLEKRLFWKYDDQYYREILLFSLDNPDNDDARKTVTDYERALNGDPALLDEESE